MIDISENERRRAFSIWLRTGRLPSPQGPDGIERKFNPWHDPETGRFTFVGAGRSYGQGGRGGAAGSWDQPAHPAPAPSHGPARRIASQVPRRTASPNARDTAPKASDRGAGPWAGGGFTGGGGGSFGGGGAAGTWGSAEREARPTSSRISTRAITPSNRAAAPRTVTARPAKPPSDGLRTVVRNGYTYQIDARERTRHVSGSLTIAQAPVRSRASQRQAGGSERRASDDGGHYIAARFNGPRDAFNHFAQDASVNRGAYRRLEDEWARDKRAGRAVTVQIAPQFGSNSVRPSNINVWWTVDGLKKSARFVNKPPEKRHGGK
ncbi:DNA/RNA non-specific endonuclease [Sphingomonas morindae]|uniref:DNA/RNA non-specific endonuclease n=1 Tax=Sphingomonas morindae TaxID=1541170 RepID=A0ABY4X4A7_9SPHN|nr:DNA/RNA non-specific endonuclease [Sphingomonas morindae]USI71737.1 DNA/RNA non-specific endonuclease [Sphingomonas morindae]